MGKKILVLANFDVGLYKFRKELLQALLDKGYEVYISLPNGTLVEKLTRMGCRFVGTPLDRRGLNPVKDLGLLLQYRKLLKGLKPDMVITYTIKPNIYGGLACRLQKRRYAVNITGLGTAFQSGGLLKRLVVFLYRVSCRKACTVFFENQENRDLFLKEGMAKERQACLLNGAGVNLSEYPLTGYPKDDGGIRFLFIGRVMKEKGMDELFAAMRHIKKDFPQAQLDVVGMYEDDYRSWIDELVKEDVIHFHGYQEDVRPFIQRCHCFVLPSYHEGMANTLLEAGAMGRPLIASDIAGCREAVEDGVNGMLVEKGNAEALYEAMRRFAGMEWEERARLGGASRGKMEREFDKAQVVAGTVRELGL